jgi:hypothetical protein
MALLCLAGTSTGLLRAGPLPAPAQIHTTINSPATLLVALQTAYSTLRSADHDYHGHRIDAMKDIADAALLLGKDLTGDGKGGEPQKLSDLQIRSVQMSLLSVGRNAPSGAKHDPLVTLINSAIQQLHLALATETDPKAEPKPGAKVEDSVGSNLLENAALARIYEILSVGDHDYKGHRVLAMRAIAKATKILGGHLAGDGKAGEPQTISDAQLRQSETLLGQVQASFAAHDPKSVLADLNDAVKELTTALSIK